MLLPDCTTMYSKPEKLNHGGKGRPFIYDRWYYCPKLTLRPSDRLRIDSSALSGTTAILWSPIFTI